MSKAPTDYSSGYSSGSPVPPPPGFVKINFDEAVFFEENKACAGIVIRNGEGFVLVSQF